jgi:hypothetical protein
LIVIIEISNVIIPFTILDIMKSLFVVLYTILKCRYDLIYGCNKLVMYKVIQYLNYVSDYNINKLQYKNNILIIGNEKIYPINKLISGLFQDANKLFPIGVSFAFRNNIFDNVIPSSFNHYADHETKKKLDTIRLRQLQLKYRKDYNLFIGICSVDNRYLKSSYIKSLLRDSRHLNITNCIITDLSYNSWFLKSHYRFDWYDTIIIIPNKRNSRTLSNDIIKYVLKNDIITISQLNSLIKDCYNTKSIIVIENGHLYTYNIKSKDIKYIVNHHSY